MGYSYITVLNVAIWSQCGLVTFDGPTLIAELAEYPQPFQYTEESFAGAVQSVEPVGQPATPWTEETLSWREQVDLTRPRRMEESPGWTWLLPGVRDGILTGGCIEPLQHLRRTRFWPGLEGAILFRVMSEEARPERVDGILMDNENMRVFEGSAGLLLGRPMDYSDAEKERLRKLVRERSTGFAFPVICDMDFGHTAPQFVLPIGCKARIDSEAKTFGILQGAVS